MPFNLYKRFVVATYAKATCLFQRSLLNPNRIARVSPSFQKFAIYAITLFVGHKIPLKLGQKASFKNV